MAESRKPPARDDQPARAPAARDAPRRTEDKPREDTPRDEAPTPREEPVQQPTNPTARAWFTVGRTTSTWAGAPPAHGEDRPPDVVTTELVPVADADPTGEDVVVFPHGLTIRRAADRGPFTTGQRVALLLTYELAAGE